MGVFGLGRVVAASGLVLNEPVPGLGVGRGPMQVALMMHGVASLLMLAMYPGHSWIVTIGTKADPGAMRTGYIDEAWAEEHHAWWHDDIKAGKMPAQRSGAAAPALGRDLANPRTCEPAKGIIFDDDETGEHAGRRCCRPAGRHGWRAEEVSAARAHAARHQPATRADRA